MQSKLLEEYKKLYSDYISLNVDLHNYNLTFIKNRGDDSSRSCKRTIKKMRMVLYHLDKLVYKVRREHLDNWKKEVEKRKIIQPDGTIKTIRKTPYKRKKTNGHNGTTTKTI